MHPTQEPWNLLERFREDVDRLLATSGGESGDRSRVVTSQWAPPVDIAEAKDAYLLFADIPGVDTAGIEITMEGGVLTVAGERKLDEDAQRESYKRRERPSGTFYRRFSLPDTADAEHIEATGRNGVLTIRIPKKRQAQPRRIRVSG